MTRLCVGFGVLAAAGSVLAAQGTTFRRNGGDLRNLTLTRPRIAPVPASQWTDAQRAVVAEFGRDGNADNQLATLLNYPELATSVMPVVQYFGEQSELAPRQREVLILRTAWLCGSDYLWAHHAPLARSVGLAANDLQRIAEGPAARGLDPRDAALLGAADDLYWRSAIADPIWTSLSAQLNQHQMMDATFTVPAFILLATLDKSLGVQIEAGLNDRLPRKVRYLALPASPFTPLAAARIPPLEPAEWTPAIRKMLDPAESGRPIIAVYRTFARHPKLYEPRQRLSEHIRLQNTLAPRRRELLILRMGWIGRSEYEWAQHARAGRAAGLDTVRVALGPDAPGWDSLDRAVLRAADEMYRAEIVSVETWNALAPHFDAKQMMDVVVTAGGYRMVATVLNAFGVQLEPGNERFPAIK